MKTGKDTCTRCKQVPIHKDDLCVLCMAYQLGWNEALDAAREAVAEQKLVPLAKQGRFIITRNTQLWKQRQAWSELGWWDFRTSALAAVNALKETNAAPK